jgi:uncharacterized protein YgiM (DUF1202 family)
MKSILGSRVAGLCAVLLAGSLATACASGGAEPAAAPAGEKMESTADVPMLPMEIVSVKSLNVRSKPSTKAAVVGKLSKGQEVKVLQTKGAWKHVQSDGGPEGWVSGKYLKGHGK